MINNRSGIKHLLISTLIFTFSFSIFANESNCNTDAILSVMSDREMDKFKDKLCVHYFSNEFVPQQLSTDVCQNIIMSCRPTVIDLSHEHFPGRDVREIVSEDMIDFQENLQQINLIEADYGKEIGNVEFFRALKDSFSKEELANIPMCPEMKEFSNISECLAYEGMTEEDASFIQNYANAGRIEKLTNEFSTIRDSLIVEGEKLSDEKKDSLYRQMGIIGKKINESIMHNGMKNIDYKNSDLLLEKLTPHASKLAAGFDGEASAISVFESFLPGYYINNQKMAEQKMASVRQTDLILGYWWQMKVENGQRPSEELENFFKSNPVSNGNLKDILHKLRLKMAKEHAEEACSEKSRIRQKEFNDMGGACSIMNNNRKAGKIHYLRFEDFSNSLSSLSDGLNEKILSDKKDHQKILYNSTIAHKICSNKVDMMGPYQESRLPPQKFKSDGWDNLKKNIQEDLVSKQSRSQSVISSYREERKKEYEKQRLNINSSEMKKISAINESKSVNTNDPKEVIKQINPTEILKPKIDNNIANRNLNNFLGNNPVTQIVKPIVDDMGRSKLERDIESRLKVIDEKINNSRQNSAMKESVEEDSIAKERVNLDQLLKEKAELQNSLLELANTSSKKVKKTDPKPADTIADENDNSNSETSVRDDRSMRKNRDSKVASSTATDSSAMDSRDSSDIASATISEAKASVKAGGSSSVKTDFGIVLTKTGEPATDFNQMVANPSESDLIRLAEKSNGEPFLINENGEVVRVLVKKDLKGKLFFEKIKLTNEQKKKLAVKKDMVRSIKEIGSAPIRKIELDKLMKETR